MCVLGVSPVEMIVSQIGICYVMRYRSNRPRPSPAASAAAAASGDDDSVGTSVTHTCTQCLNCQERSSRVVFAAFEIQFVPRNSQKYHFSLQQDRHSTTNNVFGKVFEKHL